MATKKVSALTELTSPSGSEELLVNDGGTSKKVTIDNLLYDESIDSDHYVDASVDFAHIQDVAANSILGRNANSSGVLSEVALATTEILIGDGTGFTAAALSGDVTMANDGDVTIEDNAVTLAKMAGGTDGNIISYDASGDPVAVATGNDGQVLTSAGAGAPPAFEDAAAGGITEADTWRITSSLSIGADTNTHISANWERADTNAFGLLGTGMTESSGIFSFPSTGHWLVSWKGSMSNSAVASRYMRMICYVTVNDSTYVWAGDSIGSAYNSGSSSYYTPYCDILLDVTDISNIKVKFHAYGITSTVLSGDTNSNGTYANFIKLGDT